MSRSADEPYTVRATEKFYSELETILDGMTAYLGASYYANMLYAQVLEEINNLGYSAIGENVWFKIGTRSFYRRKCGKYIMIYEIKGETVELEHIYHGKRDVLSLLRNDSES